MDFGRRRGTRVTIGAGPRGTPARGNRIVLRNRLRHGIGNQPAHRREHGDGRGGFRSEPGAARPRSRELPKNVRRRTQRRIVARALVSAGRQRGGASWRGISGRGGDLTGLVTPTQTVAMRSAMARLEAVRRGGRCAGSRAPEGGGGSARRRGSRLSRTGLRGTCQRKHGRSDQGRDDQSSFHETPGSFVPGDTEAPHSIPATPRLESGFPRPSRRQSVHR